MSDVLMPDRCLAVEFTGGFAFGGDMLYYERCTRAGTTPHTAHADRRCCENHRCAPYTIADVEAVGAYLRRQPNSERDILRLCYQRGDGSVGSKPNLSRPADGVTAP